MIGPVSGTGRAMMASLQQAIQKGMPPDQAVQYVKSMATQGVAPLTDLYAMMNQFQRLKQQQVQPPQTPPTIKDQLNMAEQQQQMQAQQGGIAGMQAPPPAPQPMDRGLGAIDAGRMEYPKFAGGGVVALANGDLTGDAEELDIIKRFVPEFDLMTPAQQDSVRRTLDTQIRQARTRRAEGPTESVAPVRRTTDQIVPISQQVEVARQRAERPVVGYAAQLRAEAEARGEGKAAQAMRERLQKRGEEIEPESKRQRSLALAQIGAQIMEAASRPGATGLGSIGAGFARGLPAMMELQQRQRELRERYEDRMLELQQAEEMRQAGYDKEARVLAKDAQGELRGLEKTLAENQLAMERLRFSEGEATKRTRIQELGDTRRATAQAAAYEQRLDALVTTETRKKLNNPLTAPRDYTDAMREYNRAKTPEEFQAAQEKVRNIFEREKALVRGEYGVTGGAGTEIDFSNMFPPR
jgi:hypothetical protein